MGLFDKPVQRDRDLKDLFSGQPFKLMKVGFHATNSKEFGPGEAVELYVDTRENGEQLFGGFSAGILQQVKQATPDDFPVWCRVVRVDLTENKHTTALEMVSPEDAEVLESALAEHRGEPVPDEDIPF